MRKLIVKVTKAHIAKGKKGMPNSCPIALACKKYKSLGKPSVAVTILFEKSYDTYWETPKLPKKAQKFISEFDRGRKVKPFTFRISAKHYDEGYD